MMSKVEELKMLVENYARISQIRGTIEAEKSQMIKDVGYVSDELELLENAAVVTANDYRDHLARLLEENVA